MASNFVVWHIPETQYVVEIIHLVPSEDADIHHIYQCWCQPEFGKNEDGIKTATHRSGLKVLGATSKGKLVSW
jgi:hypothetical protein